MYDKQISRCILCKRIVLKRRKLFPEIDVRGSKPFFSFDKRLREINMSRPGAGWSEPHRRWSPRRRPGATFVSPLASSPRSRCHDEQVLVYIYFSISCWWCRGTQRNKKITLCCFSGRSCSFTYGSLQENNSSVFTHGENANLRFFLMMTFLPKWRKWKKYVKKLFMSFLSSSCNHHCWMSHCRIYIGKIVTSIITKILSDNSLHIEQTTIIIHKNNSSRNKYPMIM